ncbi:glycosyltransferase [Rubellimicrobium arenae]|uniref:glycosyltransferase n=1 Tax=Rubellimicrobium arenae TaxID=2817372 RepID=UPI001B3056D4
MFSYDRDLEVPDGIRVEPADAILPKSELFIYNRGLGKGSVAVFSDWFRYRMLHERGGYWVDTDVLCLQPFPAFDTVTVGREDAIRLNNAVIYAPAGDPMFLHAYERARDMGPDAPWGLAGPVLLTSLATSGKFDVRVMDPSAFYPVHWSRVVTDLLLPSRLRQAEAQCAGSLGVHLYNELFRRARVDVNRMPPRGSYLDRQFQQILGPDEVSPRLNPLDVRRRNALAVLNRKAHGAMRRFRALVPG